MPGLVISHEVGLALRFLPLMILDRIAAIDDPDSSIVSHGILRRHPLKPTLEGMVQSRDLIPLSKIAIQLETTDRLDTLRLSQATRECQGRKQTG